MSRGKPQESLATFPTVKKPTYLFSSKPLQDMTRPNLPTHLGEDPLEIFKLGVMTIKIFKQYTEISNKGLYPENFSSLLILDSLTHHLPPVWNRYCTVKH